MNIFENPMIAGMLKILSPIMENKLVPILDQVQKLIDDGYFEKLAEIVEKIDTIERSVLDLHAKVDNGNSVKSGSDIIADS